MNDEPLKSELFESLRRYLTDTDYAHLSAADQPDLTTLFSDLAGLKTEVKAESRQFKATLDSLNEALSTLRADNRALMDELAAGAERLQQQKREARREILLEMVDIYDRLSAGYLTLQNYRPLGAWFNRSHKQDVRFIESFGGGLEITLRRFEQSLQRRQVFAIECVGRMFDARLMTTLEIGHDPQLENGMVIEELRKGFLFEERVLRLAEVKVNKL
ncbi:MAG: nucleotide exchange factor GrpE [Methylomonas sp.]|jgi:molecular chaperone GrpE